MMSSRKCFYGWLAGLGRDECGRLLGLRPARSIALFGALALVVVAVAAIGILGTRSAARQGNTIAGDELTTAVVTGQLARDMDAAYATGEAALRAADPATRSRLLGTLYTSLLPAVDAQLSRCSSCTPAIRRPNTPTWRCSSGSGPPSVTCSARRT